MWHLQPTASFLRAQRYYAKKRPYELAAVLRNLDRLLVQLNESTHARSVRASYLHPEPGGVWAIDQHGPSPLRLQETRLYVFPSDPERTLYLITLGNKNEQAQDIRLASQFVQSLPKP